MSYSDRWLAPFSRNKKRLSIERIITDRLFFKNRNGIATNVHSRPRHDQFKEQVSVFSIRRLLSVKVYSYIPKLLPSTCARIFRDTPSLIIIN